MIPPMMIRIKIFEGDQRKINFWLPLFLVYLLLLPLFLLFLPFLLLGGLALWLAGRARGPLSLWWAFYELWCASKGLIIEVDSQKKDRVFIKIT